MAKQWMANWKLQVEALARVPNKPLRKMTSGNSDGSRAPLKRMLVKRAGVVSGG